MIFVSDFLEKKDYFLTFIEIQRGIAEVYRLNGKENNKRMKNFINKLPNEVFEFARLFYLLGFKPLNCQKALPFEKAFEHLRNYNV